MMGFTTEGMKRTLLDLDVDIIDTIECYDTKSQPISNRESYKDEVLKRIRNNQLLL